MCQSMKLPDRLGDTPESRKRQGNFRPGIPFGGNGMQQGVLIKEFHLLRWHEDAQMFWRGIKQRRSVVSTGSANP